MRGPALLFFYLKNMMKRIGCMLTFFFIHIQLFSQSIQGSVRDSLQPLPFATILLLNADDSSRLKGTLSNEQGMYRFDNIKSGVYLLSVQMIGYIRIYTSVQINGNIIRNFLLSADNKLLKTVTVTDSKPLVEQHADRMIFNVQNSAVAAGNNAMELLQMAPLVTIDPNGGINLKGKAHVLVMVDGRIIPNETLDNILTSLSAEQIAKIELITSPSAKYDAGATGGIINIITKKGTDMGMNGTGNMGASQSAYSRYNGGVSLNYRNSNFNIYGTLSGRKGRSYRSEQSTRTLYHDTVTLRTPTSLFGNWDSETGKIGIDYNLDKNNQIGAAIDVLSDHTNNRLVAVNNFIGMDGVPDSTYTTNSHPGGHVTYLAYNLNYKGKTLSADFTYMQYNDLTRQNLVTDIYNVQTNTMGTQTVSATRTQANYNLLTAQVDYSLPRGFESGVKIVRTRSANNLNDTMHTRYEENIFAGYINVNRQWKTLKLQAGVRAEQTDAALSGVGVHYFNVFPGIALSQQFSADWRMGLSFTSRINRPAYESLIPFVIPIDTYSQEVGNANLKPEYANSTDFTNTYRNISLTLNYTHTRDAITDFVYESAGTKIWSYTKGNFKKLESYSASLFVPFTVTKWWTSNNTLLGIHSIYSSDNVGGEMFSRGSFSVNVNSINSFTLVNGFRAELTGNYNSAAVYGLYNISAYSQINIGISRAFLSDKLNVKVGVNDLFHASGYTLSMHAGTLDSYGYSRYDSRRATISVSYKFGKEIAPAKQRANAMETEQGRLNL